MSFSHTSDLIKVEIIKNMIDTKYNGGEKMSSWDKCELSNRIEKIYSEKLS